MDDKDHTYTTGDGQKDMQRSANEQIMRTIHAFIEIQNSGNPLTPEEIDRLIEKRPPNYMILSEYSKSYRRR